MSYIWPLHAFIFEVIETAEAEVLACTFLLGRTVRHDVAVALRGGGVFVGPSLLFEYALVWRGWSQIASDVFRLES